MLNSYCLNKQIIIMLFNECGNLVEECFLLLLSNRARLWNRGQKTNGEKFARHYYI